MLCAIGLQLGSAVFPINPQNAKIASIGNYQFWQSFYPCLCLCFEFSQITRTTPLRCTILHLSQIFFTDARTFMFPALFVFGLLCRLFPAKSLAHLVIG